MHDATLDGGARVLLLSDLHLPPEPCAYRDAFVAFLNGPARGAAAVYILGDLFDAWIGDDIGIEDFALECATLKQTVASGTPIYFMRGNRDFLIGARFTAASGVTLLDDPSAVVLPDGPVLLAHGDTLCSDDRAYQRFRRVVHNRVLQWLFLHLPAALRRGIGRRLRAASSARNARVRTDPVPFADVNAEAVRALLTATRQTRFIHGHTHRPADHRVELAHGVGRRFVLADWRPERMEYLACDVNGWHRLLLAAPTCSEP